MPGSPNTSFIPKRNPALNEKRSSKKTLYIGSYVVKILFVASLIATAVVFLYERSVKSALDTEIIALNNSIATFNERDMERVLEMDLRLNQVNHRLTHTASVVSLLTAIEESTIESAQISQFSLERDTDTTFKIDAGITTGSFDSVIFQRKLFEESEIFSISELRDVQLDNIPPDNGLFTNDITLNGEGVQVSFKATLEVNAKEIPHTAPGVSLPSPELVPVIEPTVTPEETEAAQGTGAVDVDDNNQADI